MTRNYQGPLTAAYQLRLKDDEFIVRVLKEAREQPGRMPYEATAIDREIHRIEQRQYVQESNT